MPVDVEGSLGRLFIGDRVGERLTILPFDVTSGELGPPRAVQLDPGALGVSVVRVSPRSEAGKFLYAVARDVTDPEKKHPGVIVAHLLDAASMKSSWALFDASSVSRGPIARAHVPTPCHLGFHTYFERKAAEA